MQLLNSTKISGNTARLVETRFFHIMNASVCDKTNYSPRTLQFVENIMGCPAVPSTQRWIARVPAVEGLFENQQKSFTVDSVNPKITYVPINQFHPSVTGNYATLRIAKFEETEDGMRLLASNTIPQPTTNAFIKEIVSQSTDYLFVLVGTSNTNRFYLMRINKSDLSNNLTMHDVGAFINLEYIGENGDEMLFLQTLPGTAAGRWTLIQRNKLTNVTSSVALLAGHSSAITVCGTAMKKEGSLVTHYRCYQKATTPYNWVVSKVVIDLSKIAATAVVGYMTSKVDLDVPTAIWLPANNNAVVKMHEITDSTGAKYLALLYMQTSLDTEFSSGDGHIFSIDSDTGNLTYVGTTPSIASNGVRGYIPLNNGKSLVAISKVGVSFSIFNESTKKYDKVKEILSSPYSIGVTANEDVIVTNSDYTVHLFSNSIPVQVNTVLKTPILGNVPAAGLSNAILVDAVDAGSGGRIAIKTKLQIDGTNAIWDATGNREVVVTTSATGTIEVPITLTEGGDFVIRALNE